MLSIHLKENCSRFGLTNISSHKAGGKRVWRDQPLSQYRNSSYRDENALMTVSKAAQTAADVNCKLDSSSMILRFC
jgi:hypothetical protein